MDYYYSQDGSRWVGPVSAKGLKDLARQGVVTPMSLLMSPDRIPPTSAHKAQGLFEAEPLPSAIESMPDEVQAKSIFGSAFSLVSGAVSTVSTAIIPVRSRSVAPVEPPTAPPVPVSASPVVAPVVVNCPVPVVEDVIGPFVFSPQGGTQIKGTIDKRFNAVIPGGLVAGKVELFVHQGGIRMEQKNAEPFAILYSEMKVVKPIKHGELRAATTGGTVAASAAGYLILGPLGAFLGAAMSRQEMNYTQDFVYMEDIEGDQLLISTTAQAAQLFAERIREQCRPKRRFGFFR